MSKKDLQTRIDADCPSDHVFVDEFDDRVWLSVNLRGGHARVTLTMDGAEKLIDAVRAVIDAHKEKNT